MKTNTFLLIIVALIYLPLVGSSQSLYDSLDINNIKARIFPANDLFKSIGTSTGFEVPKGSGNGTIFRSQMWIGGKDQGGNLKLAASTYRQSGTDFWSGPLDSVTASTDSLEIEAYNAVWKINKSDIDSFLNCCYNNIGCNGGLIVPDYLKTWPGNGNPVRNEGHILAPFYDSNGDGIYNYRDCDYPCIKGDQAIFYIFNDEGGIHTESVGAALGIEVHAMVYAFNMPQDSALNNTIFVNYKIINRSQYTINDCWIGNWTDIDIGSDNQGCDVSRSAYYGYDAHNFAPGYGAHPPAQGVVLLKGPLADANDGKDNNHNGTIDEPGETYVMSNFMGYHNDSSIMGNPSTAPDYYDYMKSIWFDGIPLTYGGDGHGGTIPTIYAFPDSSDPTNWGTGLGVNNGPPPPSGNWNELTAGIAPYDIRGVGSWGPFTFLSGETQCVDYAYVFGRDYTGDSLSSIRNLQQRVDSVRSFYLRHPELQTCECTASTVAVYNLPPEGIGFNIYPNPANNQLNIQLSSFKTNEHIHLFITNVLGQILYQSVIVDAKFPIDISSFASGIYFLQLQTESGSVAKKFVKE